MPFDQLDFQIETKPEVDEVGRLILAARELLSDPAKWFKGNYICKQTGAMCILGALGWRDDINFDYPSKVAKAAADRIADLDGIYIPEFNDDPDTTHEQVLALLDRAAYAKPE